MIRRLMIACLVCTLPVATAAIVSAQGKGPGQAQGAGCGAGQQAGQVNTVTLFGLVKSVQVVAGHGAPSLTVAAGDKEVTVMLGPYWRLQENNFDIKAGSQVTIEAIQSLRYANTYVALRLINQDTGSTTVLRDGSGAPAWSAGGPGPRGLGAMAGIGECGLNLEGKQTIEGVVEAVNMGAFQGFPNFTLVQPDGKRTTVVASPFRMILDADYRISIGDTMSVVGFPSTWHEGAYVAAELNNRTTGQVLVLRGEDGSPVGGMQGRGPGPCASF